MSVAQSPELAVQQGEHRRLSHEECTSCLATSHEGRLGYLSGRGHRRVVTRYVLSGDHIIFRVPDYNDAAHYAPGAVVSLVVEGTSETVGDHRSVRVSGRATLVSPDVVLPTQEKHLDRWPPEVATSLIRLPLASVSGVVRTPVPAARSRQVAQ